ncbi:TPA: DUF551 domain-containing protein [Yersinia enterocolitica]|uniref:DUF551 domain-containing protein n=1 Tax=Yersinia enterocolitica TaxID=630 RepID=UPI003CFF9F61
MKELDGFTVEQLNDFIKSDHTQCGDVAALARIALAAKRAEPVAYITYNGYLIHAGDPKLSEYSDPQPLYDTPQLNSQVPLGSWIKCSDQMPEDDTLCLGVDECGVIWTMHFDDGEFRADTGDVDDLEISHWMPLPAAPEKENG